ncbi:MAG: LysM peptidoglycan-binding domain-containing protein [Thermomonas sp.]|uniref:LysM peptidoglycan-binding domain-containing protein n=1 Tax=Thermomonas sp. TaxID=1971895 RepID=UPI001ED2D2F9|nr:LysM peptidoglycan-binding domain-containing protein [Thermomonas sp.]MBV2208548.1 LysM peptidoglycan-binding domain-containing protein [Thermomonas sp.]
MLEQVSKQTRATAARPRGLRVMLAAALLTVATYAAAVEMRGDHPSTYVVKRGDTLWDISAKFLKKPWLWPEIWQANPQIKNPHWIYPGDVLSLGHLDRVAVQQGDRNNASPINAVPLKEVEPFLKDTRIVDSIDDLPYVVGLEDNRLRATRGQVAYVRGLEGVTPGQRYIVVRAEKRYRMVERAGLCCDLFQSDDLDARGKRGPDDGTLWSNVVFPSKNNEILGYELMTQTTGTITRGEVAGIQASTLLLDAEGRDVRVGDRLLPVEAQTYDLQFFPHPPKQQAKYGRLTIMAVSDGYKSAGTHNVIAISGGAREGIDNGTVFSIWKRGDSTVDHVKGGLDKDESLTLHENKVRLPDEFAGHAMVFRTFNNVSYALVMSSVKPALVGYELKHPDAPY